ncbi:MAG: alkaline phosphatase [SAR86 cluster bacterium]|uniref:Alkaline phosphatase n=1 Tax=SAR86 cluster bacterium TaxID=2030880 RepID=A0A937IEV7_9GAMM|nr:alkaline phosphatase [SAR86 cluster bacterium]
MKTFFKYLLTIVLSALATFILINQYAPLLISVPDKDMELVDFDFNQTINQKKIVSVPSKAKNIIFLIGDGMGSNHIAAYRVIKGGPNFVTAFDRFSTSGLVKTHAVDSLVTDSAASATAFSSGVKTKNRYIGKAPDGSSVRNITELLFDRGYISSLIATSEITHATPASFAAHNISRYNTDEIASDIFNSNIHIVLGGGKGFFMPETLGGLRKDDTNFVQRMIDEYIFLNSADDLENIPDSLGSKVFGLFAQEELGLVDSDPSLLEMLDYAYQLSDQTVQNQNCKGFFIMAEGSQIDWRSHDNDFIGMIAQMDEFNATVNAALDYAQSREDTLVVVTADHETGGLLIEQDNQRYRASKNIKATWNTAVGRGSHTGAMVPIFAYGPGAENFSGILDNTDVFYAMSEAIGISELELTVCK